MTFDYDDNSIQVLYETYGSGNITTLYIRTICRE